MEAHHPHPVTHKKKWTEYVLEFFMLFLAVFLGFLAENVRENIHNKEIQKRNIESLLKNLHDDSVNLVESYNVNQKRFFYLDSIINLKNSNVSDTVFKQLFIYYDLKVSYIEYFQSNQTTFDQMQSSGTLRLINQDVLDSILDYEAEYKIVKRQEDICSVWWNKSIEQESLSFDWTSVAQLPPDMLWEISLSDITIIPLPYINRNLSAIQAYFNFRVSERISLGYYIKDLHKLLSCIQTLIPFLKKEYNIQ